MKNIHCERTFPVDPTLLWELVVDPDHYQTWIEAFAAGSYFVGDWTTGSPLRFVIENENGTSSGMLTEIAESRYPEFISIRSLGLIIDDVADYDSPEARKWTPHYENYHFLHQADGSSIFAVDQELPDDETAEFQANWEKAFDLMALRLQTSKDIGKVINLREKSTKSPAEIWHKLVTPAEVMTWNFASDDWHCPKAKNHLVVGGEFHYEMAAKDASTSFDYWGTFEVIEPPTKLYFTLGDGRKVRIDIIEKPVGIIEKPDTHEKPDTLEEPAMHEEADIREKPAGCVIEERFEAILEDNLFLQRQGWQSILRNLAR